MKSKTWLGVDASLRGSGLVAIDENDRIVHIARIAPCDKLFKDEDLIDIVRAGHEEFFRCHLKDFDMQSWAIERLAYGGASGSKDKINAGWWAIRCGMKTSMIKAGLEYIVPVQVAVNTWRSHVINSEDRKANKAKDKPDKNFLKECPMSKLPKHATDDIEKYCEEFKRDAMYDLCDAYWIAWWLKNKC